MILGFLPQSNTIHNSIGNGEPVIRNIIKKSTNREVDSDSHLTFPIHNNPFGGDYFKSLTSDNKRQVQLEKPSRMEIKV